MPIPVHAEVRPWPAWVPLREAAEYARMSSRRLLALVREGEISGYQDTEDRRGSKGEGRWWVNIPSIDAYHDARAGTGAVRQAVLATRRGMGL